MCLSYVYYVLPINSSELLSNINNNAERKSPVDRFINYSVEFSEGARCLISSSVRLNGLKTSVYGGCKKIDSQIDCRMWTIAIYM